MSLKGKLILSYLVVGLLPLLAVSFYSYQKSSTSFEKAATEKLLAVREVKGEAVKRYFNGVRDQLLTFSDDVMITDAMTAFKKEFVSFSEENSLSKADMIVYKSSLSKFYGDQFATKYEQETGGSVNTQALLSKLGDIEIALQYHYISSNPNPLGSKDRLDRASDKSSYSKTHKKYHPHIRKFLDKFGYYDIFLVNIDSGDIVYSVYKELDFATSLLHGPYSGTNIAEAFKKARNIRDRESFVLVDYQKYTPSYEAPASFIAAPIWNDNNERVGIAIFQMPIDRLNQIMSERAGMGETGETYLFGKDKLMRSDSFLDKENHNVVSSFKNPEKGGLSGPSIDKVLQGNAGNAISKNYLGHEVISAYTPIEILGLSWGLIAEISAEEALAAATSLRHIIFVISGISIGAILLLAFAMSIRLVKDLADRVNKVADKLFASAREVAATSDNILGSSVQLSEAATEQASSLQETVSSIDEISSMIQRNADAAEGSTRVSGQSHQAAARGKETVQSMISSINEIASGNEEIAGEMERNNAQISKIIGVISEIGEKTKVINDIVFQTKLLSFNASVEAARAGEHGKGFAVVAEEVGNLASMSGKAALEITDMLDSSIKEVTDIVESAKKKVEGLVLKSKDRVESGTKIANECGNSLDEILENASSVNEMVREIASASNEQSTGVKEVTKAMQQLDQTTHQNTSIAQESSDMAKKLKFRADELNKIIGELMAVINGDSSEGVQNDHNNSLTHTTANLGQSEIRRDNVVAMNARADSKIFSANKGVKVSGLDTSIPSESDSRFEDL